MCVRLDPTGKIPAECRDFKYIESLPEALFSTRSRPDGTYRIDGLPREAQLLCLINPGTEYEPLNPTIATTTGALPGVLSLGHDAVLDHCFLLPREVRLTVRYSDTGRPARAATVRAMSERTLLRAGSVGTTDDDGRTTLHLRPGEYELAIEPPLDAPYRPARKPVKIGPEDVAAIDELKLEPAAFVTLEAVDAKTGAGIEGVRFQYEAGTSHKRRSLPSQLVIVDHPFTDESRPVARDRRAGPAAILRRVRTAGLDVSKARPAIGSISRPAGRPRPASPSRGSRSPRRMGPRGAIPPSSPRSWSRRGDASNGRPGRGGSASASIPSVASLRSPGPRWTHSSRRLTGMRPPTSQRCPSPGSP